MAQSRQANATNMTTTPAPATTATPVVVTNVLSLTTVQPSITMNPVDAAILTGIAGALSLSFLVMNFGNSRLDNPRCVPTKPTKLRRVKYDGNYDDSLNTYFTLEGKSDRRSFPQHEATAWMNAQIKHNENKFDATPFIRNGRSSYVGYSPYFTLDGQNSKISISPSDVSAWMDAPETRIGPNFPPSSLAFQKSQTSLMGCRIRIPRDVRNSLRDDSGLGHQKLAEVVMTVKSNFFTFPVEIVTKHSHDLPSNSYRQAIKRQ